VRRGTPTAGVGAAPVATWPAHPGGGVVPAIVRGTAADRQSAPAAATVKVERVLWRALYALSPRR